MPEARTWEKMAASVSSDEMYSIAKGTKVWLYEVCDVLDTLADFLSHLDDMP